MLEFAHRRMPLAYTIAADGSVIRCRCRNTLGQETHSSNSVAYSATVDFAVFLFCSPDWEWKGGGFMCRIADKSENAMKARGPYEWCMVSAMKKEPSSPLPPGFYTTL